MMKQIIVIVLGLLSLSGITQDKLLSIEDAIIGRWTYLQPENLGDLQWVDNDNVSFTKDGALKRFDVAKGEEGIIITKDQLNEKLTKSGFEILSRFPRVNWVNGSQFSFYHKNNWLVYDLNDEDITIKMSLGENSKKYDRSLETNHIAYTVENNLFIQRARGGLIQVTEEPNPGIVYGQDVHRREFGINKGTFWSPEGNYLAFYRKDETMVTDYPIVDITSRIASLNSTKYPMAGMASHHVTLGIYDLKTGQIHYVKVDGDPEQYLTNVAWSPDEKSIYIAVLNRGQNHMKLNEYDVKSGEYVKTLFEEKHDKYVEPLHSMEFNPVNANEFIWQSRKDGYNHIYLYNTDGELIKQLTKGEWEVTDVCRFDKNGKSIVFEATKESPIESHVYNVNLKSGKISHLTEEKGVHNAIVNPAGSLFVDVYSNKETPRAINIVNAKGKVQHEMLKANDPFVKYDMPEIEVSTIKSADGETDLYYRLVKPLNYDPNKKYPAIIYVYGGPHSQLVTDAWMGSVRLWQVYMAQKGYVNLTIDNRGTANRGAEFENVIHRQLGVPEVADQMEGVKFLENLGYVDMNRIGVHGWSYGGFMTTSLMVKHPDVFKAGVAGGPVIDWSLYEVMYGERYMDTPQENLEGYKENTLTNYVENLKGKLMLIHGGIDPTVVWQHSQLFLDECIKKGVLLDYMVYPTHEHNVRGYDRIHLMRTVTRYFDENLK